MRAHIAFSPWPLLAFLLAGLVLATPVRADSVRVLTTGLGSGTVRANPMIIPIDCAPGAATGCEFYFPPLVLPPLLVPLEAIPSPGSVFVGWHGNCSGTGSCGVVLLGNWSVRAEFQPAPALAIPALTSADITPTGIAAYLADPQKAHVNDAAKFLRALPPEYKQGWILMTRSESLQTGTARFPRVMLPSADARNVLTLGLAKHDAYPGSHPDAIEYMQWDATQKNFRFHEIVLNTIPRVTANKIAPNGAVITIETFPERLRGVSIDEPRCTRCHSTRNIPNPNPAHAGTTGAPAGVVLAKNKPNWDSYDSWGGAMPFNRDRIYQGSLEAAAFRKLFNPWTWSTNVPVRQVMEQLLLQPDSPLVPPQDRITRMNGDLWDGNVVFPFDSSTIVTIEPAPVGRVETFPLPNGATRTEPATRAPNYAFDNQAGMGVPSTVQRSGARVTLHEFATPSSEEGRAVQLFDRLAGLDGSFNQTRVGDELASHRFATGSVPMDVRPIALAINSGCLRIDSTANRLVTTSPNYSLTFDQDFFKYRNNGLGIAEILADTRARAMDLPRRKADIQKFNLDRDGDPYLRGSSALMTDLLSEYGSRTTLGSAPTIGRLRQEVFRRNIDATGPDQSIMGGNLYVDRDLHDSNNDRVAQFRFLLEPLGVSVDKWSMGVRGRSRTYTFADVFDTYIGPIRNEIVASLVSRPYAGSVALNPNDCGSLIQATNEVLASPLPGRDAVPPYTDVQRIFNKGCIECHGGLEYPPFSAFPTIDMDFSEEENPASGNRLARAHGRALAFTTNSLGGSKIWNRIDATNEGCPYGMMPCGGPALSQADVHTIKRWIEGGRPSTAGDPHLTTMDGTHYDFQSAGEFTMLRDELFELQVRQAPVQADAPLPPDAHTGLASCPSINTATALRVGPHRITYQPDPNGRPNPDGLQLRVDGNLVEKLDSRGFALSAGGRILPTTAGGIQIEYPGGTDIVITPGWWDYYQLWYLNIDVRRSRAIFGVMGQIQPRNWLPAFPNGSLPGERPANLADRYQQLYGKFADAWRVTKSSGLFDYAPGTSTATFTLKGWPNDQADGCKLPAGWEPKLPPQKPISAGAAKEICGALVDAQRRANCTADVMATGETGFAKTYLATEQIQRNHVPRAPDLLAPLADELDLPDAVDFAWEPTTDKDGGKLTYLHCVWPVGEQQTFNHCKPVSARETRTYVTGLESNRAYHWKLVVDDGQGGTIDSEMRRFKTK